MEVSFVRSPISEVAEADAITIAQLLREADPGSNRDTRTHDARLAKIPDREVGKVHRPAFAAVHACRLPEELTHQRVYGRTLGDGMPMRAVVANHVVIGTQRQRRSNDLALLSQRRVDCPGICPDRCSSSTFKSKLRMRIIRVSISTSSDSSNTDAVASSVLRSITFSPR